MVRSTVCQRRWASVAHAPPQARTSIQKAPLFGGDERVSLPHRSDQSARFGQGQRSGSAPAVLPAAPRKLRGRLRLRSLVRGTRLLVPASYPDGDESGRLCAGGTKTGGPGKIRQLSD